MAKTWPRLAFAAWTRQNLVLGFISSDLAKAWLRVVTYALTPSRERFSFCRDGNKMTLKGGSVLVNTTLELTLLCL